MQYRPISRASQKIEALAASLSCECTDIGPVGSTIEARHRRTRDRHFAALLTLMLPRINRLIVQYRMLDMADDAQQAAAIGVFRALQTYDPAKASFVTHATWQMRGELQSLRHRVRLDQRRSAVSAGISTVSLDGLNAAAGTSDEPFYAFEPPDEAALTQAEHAASNHMARSALDRMLDRLGAPDHERMIVQQYVLDNRERAVSDATRASRQSAEQRRQIVRRTLRNCAKVMAG